MNKRRSSGNGATSKRRSGNSDTKPVDVDDHNDAVADDDKAQEHDKEASIVAVNEKKSKKQANHKNQDQ